MKKEKLIEMYEQLEVSLYRAEKGKKDIDVLVCLRCLFSIIDFMLKGGFYVAECSDKGK